MQRSTVALVSVFAVILGACDSPAASGTRAPTEPLSVRSSNGPEHRVTGGGQLDVALFPGAEKESYGFSAVVDADGNARGQMAIDFSDEAPFHLEVTCLSVKGNDAWIGGVVTQTHDATAIPVGLQMWVRVRDNGDPSGGAPDQMGFFRFAPANFCLLQRPSPLAFNWLHGNIVVK